MSSHQNNMKQSWLSGSNSLFIDDVHSNLFIPAIAQILQKLEARHMIGLFYPPLISSNVVTGVQKYRVDG
jgi:hypothetical protein